MEAIFSQAALSGLYLQWGSLYTVKKKKKIPSAIRIWDGR